MPIEFWNIPKIWKNGTVFILGGGPSLSDMDLSPLKGKRVIGVNEGFTLGADVCWFGDIRWYTAAWKRPVLPLREFPGLIATCCTLTGPMPGVKRVRRGKPTGIETKPGYISWNRCSGSSAINLAVHFGCKRIVLLGFDMKAKELTEEEKKEIDDLLAKTSGYKTNWHDRHKNRAKPDEYKKRFLPPFKDIARDLKDLGVECLNATPDSAIEVFPKVRLEDVV